MSEQNNLTPDMNDNDKTQRRLERLQSTLNRACKNVPFHRNRIREAGLSDFTGLGDIEKLPFMDRTHLATHYPYGLFAVPLRDIVRIHTAPGSGTSPSISGYTKTDLMIWKKNGCRCLCRSQCNGQGYYPDPSAPPALPTGQGIIKTAERPLGPA